MSRFAVSRPGPVPKTIGPYILFLVLGIGGVAFLEHLYWIEPTLGEKLDLPQEFRHETFQGIDLSAPGSLGCWFLSILWFCAATVSLSVFRLGKINRELMRRSRTCAESTEHTEHAKKTTPDDETFFPEKPPARPFAEPCFLASDIWLCAAACCLFLSADAVCRLRELIRLFGVAFGGTELYAQGHLWWVGAYALLLGMVGSRLLAEMRHLLISCNAFFIGALFHLLNCCFVLELVRIPGDARYVVMVRSSLEIVGTIFLVLAFALYARRMLLFGTALEMSLEHEQTSKKNGFERANEADETASATEQVDESDKTDDAERAENAEMSDEEPHDVSESQAPDGWKRRSQRGRRSKGSHPARARSLHIVHPSNQGVKEVRIDDEDDESNEDEEEYGDDFPPRRKKRRKNDRPYKSKRKRPEEPVFYELDDPDEGDEYEDYENNTEEYNEYAEDDDYKNDDNDSDEDDGEYDRYEPPHRRSKRDSKKRSRRSPHRDEYD